MIMRFPNRLTTLTLAVHALALFATACAPELDVVDDATAEAAEADASVEAAEAEASNKALDKCLILLDYYTPLVGQFRPKALEVLSIDNRSAGQERMAAIDAELRREVTKTSLTCAKAETYRVLFQKGYIVKAIISGKDVAENRRKLQVALAVLIGMSAATAEGVVEEMLEIDPPGGTVEDKCSASQKEKLEDLHEDIEDLFSDINRELSKCGSEHRCLNGSNQRWQDAKREVFIAALTLFKGIAEGNYNKEMKSVAAVYARTLSRKYATTIFELGRMVDDALNRFGGVCYGPVLFELLKNLGVLRDSLKALDNAPAPAA
jgi:hypothetical protein